MSKLEPIKGTFIIIPSINISVFCSVEPEQEKNKKQAKSGEVSL